MCLRDSEICLPLPPEYSVCDTTAQLFSIEMCHLDLSCNQNMSKDKFLILFCLIRGRINEITQKPAGGDQGSQCNLKKGSKSSSTPTPRLCGHTGPETHHLFKRRRRALKVFFFFS